MIAVGGSMKGKVLPDVYHRRRVPRNAKLAVDDRARTTIELIGAGNSGKRGTEFLGCGALHVVLNSWRRKGRIVIDTVNSVRLRSHGDVLRQRRVNIGDVRRVCEGAKYASSSHSAYVNKFALGACSLSNSPNIFTVR